MPPSKLFPKSLLLHFPPQVYQRTSPSDLLPKVLEIVKPEVLRCAQFLQGGKVCLSFKEKSDLDHLLYEGLCVNGVDIPVTEHGKKLTIVYLRDLPFEVSSDDLYAFFADYGDVTTINRSTSSTCSSLFDGNRVVKIVLDKEIPYFLSVLGHDCCAWYRDQTPECSVCREPGHRSQSCPFSGLCLHCRQPGHRAKECGRAWAPALLSSSDAPAPVENAASVPDPSVPDPSVPTSDPDPSDDPVDIEVDPPPPPVVPDPVLLVEPVPNDVNVPILVSVDVHMPPHVDASPKVDVVPVGDPPASAEESVTCESSGSSVKSKSKKHNVIEYYVAVPKEHSLDPLYAKAYRAIRTAIRELSLQKVVNLPSSELRTFALDALWKNQCPNDDNERFSAILSCLSRLKKHCKKNNLCFKV